MINERVEPEANSDLMINKPVEPEANSELIPDPVREEAGLLEEWETVDRGEFTGEMPHWDDYRAYLSFVGRGRKNESLGMFKREYTLLEEYVSRTI